MRRRPAGWSWRQPSCVWRTSGAWSRSWKKSSPVRRTRDNLRPVMMELYAILGGAGDYSLSFGTVDAEEPIVRRSISMTYTAGSYAAAKDILQRLHDSAYRCMLDSVNISIGQGGDGPVSVNSTIVFFEYQ